VKEKNKQAIKPLVCSEKSAGWWRKYPTKHQTLLLLGARTTGKIWTLYIL